MLNVAMVGCASECAGVAGAVLVYLTLQLYRDIVALSTNDIGILLTGW
jgi:hypothetical protein